VVDHFHHFGHGAMLPSPAMARVNVELKAFDRDPDATASRCVNLGAADAGLLSQRDTYFAARRGRLKLRVEEGALGGELIAYRREDDAEPIESGYVVAAVAAPEELAEALDASLGTVVVVSKRRRLFLWEGVRIHLDEVDGLGSFVEFEAVLPDAGDLATAHAKVDRLRTELGITDDALVAVGYSDLLIDGPQALLRAASEAMRNAYAPYSEFKVGAAVRGRSGAIFAGANVENVAYPQGQCAEASALGAMVAAGETAITAVAVVAERLEVCPPCGGCRQRLSEFGDAATPVYLGPTTTTLGELLPGAFDRGALA
jgi:homotetrameric cytidine deaminase